MEVIHFELFKNGSFIYVTVDERVVIIYRPDFENWVKENLEKEIDYGTCSSTHRDLEWYLISTK